MLLINNKNYTMMLVLLAIITIVAGTCPNDATINLCQSTCQLNYTPIDNVSCNVITGTEIDCNHIDFKCNDGQIEEQCRINSDKYTHNCNQPASNHKSRNNNNGGINLKNEPEPEQGITNKKGAYIRSSYYGKPWGHTSYDDAMNKVFGTGNWDLGFFEDGNFATTGGGFFDNNAYDLLYIEGSAIIWYGVKILFNNIKNNLEVFVNNGGAVFINAAPIGTLNPIEVAFGARMQRDSFQITPYSPGQYSNGVAADVDHPIFNGRFKPAPTQWTSSSSYSYGNIHAPGFTPLMLNADNVNDPPALVAHPSKRLLVGTLTSFWFWNNWFSNPLEVGGLNLRANMLAFLLNTPPNAVCQNVVKVADASCSASIVADEVDNDSTDAEGDSLTYSVIPTSVSGAGSSNVELTVSDGKHSDTCSASVTVQDTTPPVITCPSDTTLEYAASRSFSNTGEATAADNCDNDVTITHNDVVSGDDDDKPNNYIITRTWSAVDDDNNESQCVQTITVQVDHDSTNELQTLSQDGNTITLSDGGGSVIIDVNDADNNSSNELQKLSQDGNTITLSDGGGSVIIDVNDADNNSSNELQKLSQDGNTITLSDGGGSVTIDVNDADNNSSNELQTLSQDGNTIALSDGGGTISIADNDNDSSNELQTLSQNGNTIALSDGGSVTIDVNDADNNSSNELQTLSQDGNTIALSDGGGAISIDSDPTNELQSLSSSASGTIRTINIRDGSGTNIDVADNDNSATNEIQTLTVTKGQGNEYTFEFDKGNVIIDNTNNDKSLKSNDQQNGTLDFDTIVNQVIQQSTIVQNQITNVITTSIEENTIIQNQITNVIQNSENTALIKQVLQCLMDNNGKNKVKKCADLLSQITSDDNNNNSETSSLTSSSATSLLSTMTIVIAVLVACAAMCLLTAIFVVMKLRKEMNNMNHNANNNNANTIEMITSA